MSIEQIRVGGDNFGYVIHPETTKEAALVDPGMDATYAINYIRDNKLNLLYIINTHHHRDHTASNRHVQEELGGKVLASEADAPFIKDCVDKLVGDGEVLMLGTVKMEFLVTPGHTKGGLCIIVEDKYLLTGDTLFIGDCGRTDFPGGSNEQMYRTIQRLKALPDHLIVYPGHDYGQKPYETLGNQKMVNKTLQATTLKDFMVIP